MPEEQPFQETQEQESELPPERAAVQQPRLHPDKPDNMIYVGRKNVMSYVLAVVTQFNNGASEVTLKARGKSICSAVDATQIIKHRFIQSLQIRDIKLSTEELMSEDGSMSRVSSMEILMTK